MCIIIIIIMKDDRVVTTAADRKCGLTFQRWWRRFLPLLDLCRQEQQPVGAAVVRPRRLHDGADAAEAEHLCFMDFSFMIGGWSVRPSLAHPLGRV